MRNAGGFFKKIEENGRYQVVFFIVSMCLVLGFYVGLRERVEKDVLQQYQVIEDNKLVKYVEAVKIEDDILTISGWCFYKGVNGKECSIQVFLRNVDDEKDVIWLDVKRVEREDINVYYDSEINYRDCGFEASTKVREIEKRNADYEIFVKVTYEEEDEYEPTRKTVSTKRCIQNGKLTAINKNQETNIFSESSELNEVMEKGTLLICRNDYDICVYQYNNKLYWVAGEDFFFEEDNSTYIQYQLFTTRTDKLPPRRVERELVFDNIGFDFEKKELTEDATPFRVAVCDIPQDYPITYIETGYFVDSKWIWVERVNIDVRSLVNK